MRGAFVIISYKYTLLPWKITCSTSSSLMPDAARTSASFTPVQVALLIALLPQESPLTDFTEAILLRLFPAHCTAAEMVWTLNLFFNSGTLNISGLLIPKRLTKCYTDAFLMLHNTMWVSRSFPLLAPIQLFQSFIYSDKYETLLQLHAYNKGIKRLVTLLQMRFMTDIHVLLKGSVPFRICGLYLHRKLLFWTCFHLWFVALEGGSWQRIFHWVCSSCQLEVLGAVLHWTVSMN